MLRSVCLGCAAISALLGIALLVVRDARAADCYIRCRHFTDICSGGTLTDDCIIYLPGQGHDQYYASQSDGISLRSTGGSCQVWEAIGGTKCLNVSAGLNQECQSCVQQTQLSPVPRYECYGLTTS